MKFFVLIMAFQIVLSINSYADNRIVNPQGKVDVTFGYYDKFSQEFTAIREYVDWQLYWSVNPRFITIDDDMDGNYYIGVKQFGIKWGDSNNNFNWIDGKPYSLVKMRENISSTNYIEVTLPVVYFVNNTVIIYDSIDSITKNVKGANALRIILYGSGVLE